MSMSPFEAVQLFYPVWKKLVLSQPLLVLRNPVPALLCLSEAVLLHVV